MNDAVDLGLGNLSAVFSSIRCLGYCPPGSLSAACGLRSARLLEPQKNIFNPP